MPLVAPPVTSDASLTLTPIISCTCIFAFVAETSQVTSSSQVTVTSIFSFRPYVKSNAGFDVILTVLIAASSSSFTVTSAELVVPTV